MQEIPHISFHGSDRLEAEGFELLSLQSLFARRETSLNHNPHQPHRITFNILMVITSGEARHFVDFTTYKLLPGNCLQLFSHQVHAFDSSPRVKGYLILFTDAFLYKNLHPDVHTYLMQNVKYRRARVAFHAPELQVELLQRLQQLSTKGIFRKSEIGAILTSFYARLFSDEPAHVQVNNQKYQAHFLRFNRLIEDYYRESRSANFFAEKMGITYKHLNEICQKCTSLPAKRYIDEWVVLEAKRMLVSTSLSIKEIAYELGFDEPTNFQKYLKRHLTCTAREFRDQYA
ncbi:MAG: helix-turn-helix domain-containing protein [Bacteroidota bacterium]